MKTLVEQIRDMVRDARARGMYPVVTDAAEVLLGRSLWSEYDEAELFTKIADRIEREFEAETESTEECACGTMRG